MCAPNTPLLRSGGGAEALVQPLRVFRCGGRSEARAVPPPGVAVEGELADAQDLALAQGLVHAALRVCEQPQRAHLLGQPLGRGGARRRG